MSFIAKLRICLFLLSVLSDSSKTCYFRQYSFYTTVVNYGLYEPYLLLKNSSFILIFVRVAQEMFILNLGQICRDSEANIWKPA